MAIERKNSFHLLLSDDELKLLRLLAEREGLNASDYLRSLLRQMAGTPPHMAQVIRLGAALGGNLELVKAFEAHTQARNELASKPEATKAKTSRAKRKRS
jgi:hypothetical protein